MEKALCRGRVYKNRTAKSIFFKGHHESVKFFMENMSWLQKDATLQNLA